MSAELNTQTANEDLAKNSAQDALISVFASGFQSVASIAALIVLTRLLTPVELGIAVATISLISIFDIWVRMGLVQAIVQRDEASQTTMSTSFVISILLGLFGSALVFLGADVIEDLLQVGESATALRVLAIFLLTSSLGQTAEGLLLRKLRFKSYMLVESSTYLLFSFGLAVILAAMGYGAIAMVAAFVTRGAVRTLLLILIERNTLRFGFNSASAKSLLKFGFGFTLGNSGSVVALNADKVIVGRALSADQLGFYSRSYSLMASGAVLFGYGFDKIGASAMAEARRSGSSLARTFAASNAVLAVALIPTSIATFITAEELILVLFGDEWTGAVSALRILSIGIFLRAAHKSNEAVIRATGKVYSRAWRQWIYAAAVVAAAVIGSNWGIEGVAVGLVLALSLNYVLMLVLVIRILETTALVAVGPAIRTTIIAILVGSLAFFVVEQYPTNSTNLVDLISIWALIFVPVFIIIRTRPTLLFGGTTNDVAGTISKMPFGRWIIDAPNEKGLSS